MSTAGPLRQPIPIGRSILWSPASARAKRPDHIPFPVFLSQAALTAIQEHLAAPRGAGQGMLGFLLGDQCECPETNVSYLVVDVALRLNQPIYGDRTRDVVTRLWDHIQTQLEQQRASLIGWYHTHPPLPLSLSAHDVETHEHYFAEPWQVALLLGTDPAEPAGSFFRSSANEDWLATPLPFYELLTAESLRPDGKKRSFVTWKNYRAYTTVAPPPATPAQREPAARVPAEPKFTPTPPSRPAPPPPPPRAAPARQPPADPGELVFLTAAEDQPPPPPPRAPTPPPPPPRTRERRPAATAPAPVTAPEPELEPEPEPAPASSEAEPGFWPDEFQDRYANVAAEPAVEEEVEPPPPKRRTRRRGRKFLRRVKAALVVLGIAAAGVGAYWWFLPHLPTVRWSEMAGGWTKVTEAWAGLTGKLAAAADKVRRAVPVLSPSPPRPKTAPRATTPSTTPPATPSSAPRSPGAVGAAVAPARPAMTKLERMADSLSKEVRLFGERARQFEGRQVPCATLASGLEAVENRWTAYNTARRAAGVLDAAHAARDQTLYAGVDSVERKYERSGCPRPP
jgi:JAB1/Mov34/MPN/PAD-1 ubiquitin protease